MFDPNLKLQWAKKHLDSLQSEIALFEQSQTCKVSTEEDIANGFYVIRVEFPDDPRQFAIALICGDFVNCLRSSLDHLAWQLALFTSNKPSRDICFPIIEKDSLDAQLRITRVTYGIPDEAVSVMKSFQPYHAGDNFKTSHLWRLNTLWNIDKHRHLAPHGVFTDWLYNTPPEALKVMRNEPLDYGYKVILPIAFKDQVKLNPNPSGARFYFGERPEGTETGVPDLVDMYEFVANTVLPAFTRFFK
jgi:hypothetical protein